MEWRREPWTLIVTDGRFTYALAPVQLNTCGSDSGIYLVWFIVTGSSSTSHYSSSPRHRFRLHRLCPTGLVRQQASQIELRASKHSLTPKLSQHLIRYPSFTSAGAADPACRRRLCHRCRQLVTRSITAAAFLSPRQVTSCLPQPLVLHTQPTDTHKHPYTFTFSHIHPSNTPLLAVSFVATAIKRPDIPRCIRRIDSITSTSPCTTAEQT